MTTSRSTTRSVASLAVAVTLVASAGCGKAAEKVAEKATEEAIENQVGGNVDLDVDGDGGVRIETEEGTYEAEGQGNVNIETDDGSISSSAKVPDGWPEDVPLPDDLAITMGGTQDTGDGVLLTVSGTSSTEPKELLEELKVAFADWEIKGESVFEVDPEEVVNAQWETDGRRLTLTAASDGAGTTEVILSHSILP